MREFKLFIDEQFTDAASGETYQSINLGLIGSGGQGQYLSEAAKITGQVELVACADVRPEAAQATAAMLGYREWYGNAAEMLDEAVIDAIFASAQSGCAVEVA